MWSLLLFIILLTNSASSQYSNDDDIFDKLKCTHTDGPKENRPLKHELNAVIQTKPQNEHGHTAISKKWAGTDKNYVLFSETQFQTKVVDQNCTTLLECGIAQQFNNLLVFAVDPSWESNNAWDDIRNDVQMLIAMIEAENPTEKCQTLVVVPTSKFVDVVDESDFRPKGHGGYSSNSKELYIKKHNEFYTKFLTKHKITDSSSRHDENIRYLVVEGGSGTQYDSLFSSSGGDETTSCTLKLAESNVFQGHDTTFSHASVLFVSVSFIILMVISLAWLIFYYVQRFRYAHAKDRLARRLFNAAKKALAKIPTRAVKQGEKELDTDCPVCIDPYAVGDVVRTLPCKHVFHKTCVDPWLLEHRTCPMCKADILKAFGYNFRNMDDGIRSPGAGEDVDQVSVDGGSDGGRGSSADDSYAGYQYMGAHGDLGFIGDPFFATPVGSPGVVQQVMHGEQAAGFSIIPLTVHSNTVTRPMTTASNPLPVRSSPAVMPTSHEHQRANSAVRHSWNSDGSTPSQDDMNGATLSATRHHHSAEIHPAPVEGTETSSSEGGVLAGSGTQQMGDSPTGSRASSNDSNDALMINAERQQVSLMKPRRHSSSESGAVAPMAKRTQQQQPRNSSRYAFRPVTAGSKGSSTNTPLPGAVSLDIEHSVPSSPTNEPPTSAVDGSSNQLSRRSSQHTVTSNSFRPRKLHNNGSNDSSSSSDESQPHVSLSSTPVVMEDVVDAPPMTSGAGSANRPTNFVNCLQRTDASNTSHVIANPANANDLEAGTITM